MSNGKLKIHSENILPIIKKWLYSDKDIFVRELVSNGCDAITKLRRLVEAKEAAPTEEAYRIDVTVDKEAKTLTFSDNGLGMDAEEVEKYIAQLAFSGAEEFLQKYKGSEEDQIIGHFGLGFYSAYMVADLVEIQTLSYKEGAEPVFWSCDGSSEYTIEAGSREKRGTTIVLHVNDDDYLDQDRVQEILAHYCSFLPYPIYINESRLNEHEPLWIKSASQCDEKEYKQFYHQLYPMEEEPLFWIHLNVDYPFNLKGILYFPRVKKDLDFKQNTIKLFCNRVFVSDNCKDLIPDYLMVLRGALDSPDIPLNVSRSYLQMDRTVRQLGQHISKKVSDRLAAMYKTEKERFLSSWRDIELILKLGAIQDEKFYERVKECLIFKTIEGEWTTVEEYLERNKEKHEGRIFYTGDEAHQPHFLELYKEKGIEVLYTNPMLDSHVIAVLEQKMPNVRFQRIDGGVDDVILDKEREKTVVDGEGKTEATRLEEFVKASLGLEQVEAKSLATDALPAFIVVDEQGRRMRDYLAMSGGDRAWLNDQYKLVVNTNSKLMGAIQKLGVKDQELAKDLLSQVYDLALLSQREMKPDALDTFINRNNAILEKLTVLSAEA